MSSHTKPTARAQRVLPPAVTIKANREQNRQARLAALAERVSRQDRRITPAVMGTTRTRLSSAWPAPLPFIAGETHWHAPSIGRDDADHARGTAHARALWRHLRGISELDGLGHGRAVMMHVVRDMVRERAAGAVVIGFAAQLGAMLDVAARASKGDIPALRELARIDGPLTLKLVSGGEDATPRLRPAPSFFRGASHWSAQPSASFMLDISSGIDAASELWRHLRNGLARGSILREIVADMVRQGDANGVVIGFAGLIGDLLEIAARAGTGDPRARYMLLRPEGQSASSMLAG
jgi:hypothetical protein